MSQASDKFVTHHSLELYRMCCRICSLYRMCSLGCRRQGITYSSFSSGWEALAASVCPSTCPPLLVPIDLLVQEEDAAGRLLLLPVGEGREGGSEGVRKKGGRERLEPLSFPPTP